jgi:hypothetical protein
VSVEELETGRPLHLESQLALRLMDGVESSTAEKHFRIAIELFCLAEQRVDVVVTYRALGDVLGSRGESEASYEGYRTGILGLEENL